MDTVTLANSFAIRIGGLVVTIGNQFLSKIVIFMGVINQPTTLFFSNFSAICAQYTRSELIREPRNFWDSFDKYGW